MRPTEAHNPISANIDIQGADGILDILQKVDAEIFTGWPEYESFKTDAVLSNIKQFATSIAASIGMDTKRSCIYDISFIWL